MPKRKGKTVHMEELSVEERLQEPDRCQAVWYDFVASWASGLSALDVGAGTGYGLDILQNAGVGPVCGIDPLPLKDYILSVPVEKLTGKSYDVVLAIDVIEHVAKDKAFLDHLIRVAKQKVFFSTPNWNVSKAQNAYHVREYTPKELVALVGKKKGVTVMYYTLDETGQPKEIKAPKDASGAFGVLLELK